MKRKARAFAKAEFKQALNPDLREDLWTCPGCQAAFATSFCPHCGEQRLRANELSLRGLISQAVHAVTSFDGPLIRAFRCLVTRPGLLTVAYLQGQRKAYSLPLPLFLMANVLFFALQS